MINIIVGAALGAALNAGLYAGIQLWTGKKIAWKALSAAVVGGAVAGGLAGATFGMSALAEGGSAALTFMAMDGGAAAGAEKMTGNALDRKPLGDGVAQAAAWGAVTAPITYGVLKGTSGYVGELLHPAGAVATAAASDTAPAAATAARSPVATTIEKALGNLGEDISDTIHHAPIVHALATNLAGAPWVSETVNNVNAEAATGQANPVDPNTGVPGAPTPPQKGMTDAITGAVGGN